MLASDLTGTGTGVRGSMYVKLIFLRINIKSEELARDAAERGFEEAWVWDYHGSVAWWRTRTDTLRTHRDRLWHHLGSLRVIVCIPAHGRGERHTRAHTVGVAREQRDDCRSMCFCFLSLPERTYGEQ